MTTRSNRPLTFTCSTCGQAKPVDAFYADPRGGIRTRCKECMNAANRARRAADPEARAKDAARRERASEDISEHQRAWRRRYPVSAMWMTARQRAKDYGREFTITREDIVIPTHCPILGIPLVAGSGDNAPSIDRIDNDKGYIPGNVWVISMRANAIKGTRSIEEAFPCFVHRPE